MSTIILCSLADRTHQSGQVYTMTVKRVVCYASVDLLVPTKRLVYGYKHFRGDARFAGYPPVSEAQYTDGYRALIMVRLHDIVIWYHSLPKDNTHTLTLCCYCPAGTFCHRRLVYKLLCWLNRKCQLCHYVKLY